MSSIGTPVSGSGLFRCQKAKPTQILRVIVLVLAALPTVKNGTNDREFRNPAVQNELAYAGRGRPG